MTESTCGICLESFQGIKNTTTTECNHAFHLHCLAKWLKSKDSCPICRINLVNPNAPTFGYIGELNAEGKRHGKGKYTYQNNTMYEGEWINGLPHGVGRFVKFQENNTKDCHEVYEGHFHLGHFHGSGKLQNYKSQKILEGEFINGTFYKGRMTDINNSDCIEGEWVRICAYDQHGNTYWNYNLKGLGNVVNCKFPNGEYTGNIIRCIIDANDVTNDSPFQMQVSAQNKFMFYPNGHGTMKYYNGSKYTGEWKKGNRHGHGILVDSDETTYEGEWQHHKKHGKGILTYKDYGTVTVKAQEWNDGNQIYSKIQPTHNYNLRSLHGSECSALRGSERSR